MAISAENLTLLRFIQERKNTHINEVAIRFSKNTSSIRREIQHINAYYKIELITIKNGFCSTEINYQQLANLIHSLPLRDYVSNQTERTDVFLVMAYFLPYVNTTKLYESWGLSMTTKKSDIASLKKDLIDYDLDIITVPQKGLTITGNMFKFRILIANILYPLYDIDSSRNISERISNTPFESLCFPYIAKMKPYFKKAYETLSIFLENYEVKITSLSEKFGLLFISFTLHTPKYNQSDLTNMPLPLTNFYIDDNRHLNEIYNRVLTLLDYSQQLFFPHDQILFNVSEAFVQHVLASIHDEIYTQDDLTDEVYHYFYRQILKRHLHVQLPDRLVRHLDEDLESLYLIIEKHANIISMTYNMTFSKEQLTTITFIFQKMILRNKIINTPRSKSILKVIIVSHASYERIDYFIYQLKDLFEVEVVSILNLSQREQIHSLQFDYIVSLSERIHNILKKEGYPVILLNYYLKATDIDKLQLFGFNRIRTKFLTNQFVTEIQNLDRASLILYLKDKYSDYFI